MANLYLFTALALAIVPLSGCIEDPAPDTDLPDDSLVGGLLMASKTQLWNNPQTAPHPAFNYPTLTNPAVGGIVPHYWDPIPAADLPAKIEGMELVTETSDAIPSGAGMSVFGRLAVVPGYSSASKIIDISDPMNPVVLSSIDEHHRNVDFIAYPDGRLIAVFSTDSGILPIWNITDPADPVRLGEMKPTAGTHKVNIVPGTPIVYNANSMGGGEMGLPPGGNVEATAVGITEIFDLTEPEAPVHVKDWKNGYGCHHIYFWINAEKARALCAGIEATQIWDIEDPRNPEVLVTIPVHHGVAGTPSASIFLMAFSHFSVLNQDGTVLIVGDEMGGGAVPPGCAARAGTPVRDMTTPAGALWFYDVTDEKNPKLQGWFSPGTPAASNPPSPGEGPNAAFYSCTAHHGRLVPDPEGRDLLAMAFYRAGVVLVDFSDPMNPAMVDQHVDGTDTWEVQYYNGYLFTGDLARGMDVLKFR